MATHGVRFKLEQIISLLRQLELLTANGKTLDETCKFLSSSYGELLKQMFDVVADFSRAP
jgi:hypothetical protein